MKSNRPKTVEKIETTLEDVATEFGLVDPLMHPSKGPTDGGKRRKAIPPDKPKATGKMTQKARKKLKESSD